MKRYALRFAGVTSVSCDALRDSCERVNILDAVNMRHVDGYEPSYKGLKLEIEASGWYINHYEPSYKGLKNVA